MASCSPTKRICLKDKEHYTIWILHMRYININKTNIFEVREKAFFSMPFPKFWSLLIVKFLMSKFWSIPLVRPTDSFDCKLKLFTSPLANSQWESRIQVIKWRVFDFFYIKVFSKYGLGIAQLWGGSIYTFLAKKTRLECQLHHHMPWCAIYMKNHHWRCIIWENTAIVERRLQQAIWDQCWKFWQIHFEWEEIHSESIKKKYFFTNQSFYHLEAMASLTSNRMDWSSEPLRARNSYTTNAPKYEIQKYKKNTGTTQVMFPNVSHRNTGIPTQ